jgi:alpha-glucosidase (family GH31 glycosyl hydrolase)
MGRQKDGELYLRWIQFGVFSPILRLHSTRIALSKEPWNHPEVEDLAKEALRFRHKLIPYIYSEYYRNHLEGRALIEPMYYGYPSKEMAYKVKGQYFFGSKLIVAPITSPINKKTGKAKVKVWLPRGEYTDIFTGEVFQGGTYVLERDLTSIPVFARSGSVIPLGCNGGNSVDNPRELELLVYRGKGRYRLYEDKGDGQEYLDGAYAVTQFRTELTEDEQKLIIFPAEGDITYVPESRDYKINFANISRYAGAEILKNGEHFEVETEKGILYLKEIKPTDKIEITLVGIK